MRRCLPDRALLLLHEGGGTTAHRAHLEACEACTNRYRRLVHDLEIIEQVLQEEPPLRASYADPYPFYVRWIPVVAAVAVGIALVWGAIWLQRPASEVFPEEARNEDVLRFWEEVSTAIFPVVDDDRSEISSADFNFAYLDAALGEESFGWPDTFPGR